MNFAFVKINHTTRILDYNNKFMKIFKYSTNTDTPIYHYFRDCINQDDLNEIFNMKDGDKISKPMHFISSRLGRGKSYNVNIQCKQNGTMKKRLDMVPKYEYIFTIDPTRLSIRAPKKYKNK